MVRFLRPLAVQTIMAAVFCSCVFAQQRLPWQPTPGHRQVPIWPGAAPDPVKYDGPEYSQIVDQPHELVAGKPWVSDERVSVPTMTVFSPKGRNTGVAVVVFPGGGYQVLAMDLEGTEVCDWLNSRGITCVLLKYRVPGSSKFPKSGGYPQAPQALDDAQRTISLTRQHAAEWHIDPNRIGVIGFSAGGHLVAATSVHFEKRVYARVDATDDVSCRPDFAIAVYPGHLMVAENSIALQPDIQDHISKRTPPTFLLQNEDDKVDGVEQALSYYMGLKKAGVPVEMHLYSQGGHAFGLRRTNLPATAWPDLVDKWLVTAGVLQQQ
jgi:acetyl esterase/lipase